VDRITVEIPAQQVEAIRRGLRTSHTAVTREAERLVRERSPHGERVGRDLTELGALKRGLEKLLAQLEATGLAGGPVTGERKHLRSAGCDALTAETEALAAAVHSYWSSGRPLAAVEVRLAAVALWVRLLHRIERA
jgi:hypothetical protein